MGREETREEHESFGLVGFTRRTGGDGRHFGSSVRSFNSIAMTVRHCARIRDDLHHTWYHAIGDVIVELELTPSQFIDAITSMGIDNGVPCTIKAINGKQVRHKPVVSSREEHVKEFKAKMESMTTKASSLLDEVTEIFSKPAVNKTDRAIVLNKISKIIEIVRSGVPFVHECFDESMDKTSNEAKAEIEAFFTSTIHNLGLEKLYEHIKSANVSLAPPEIVEDKILAIENQKDDNGGSSTEKTQADNEN